MSAQQNAIRVVLEGVKRTKIANAVEIPVLTRCCFCVPLRKGLITFAYVNLVLTLALACLVTLYVSHSRMYERSPSDLPRLIIDMVAIVLEIISTIVFIVALHKKHVLLMKVYLYFEIVFAIVGFILSVAYLNRETASELLVTLFQLTLQMYLAILIWSSIVKMERDGAVKYTRERDMPV